MIKNPDNKNPQAVKLGKMGGQATSKKLGKKHYQALASNMNKKRAEKRLTASE